MFNWNEKRRVRDLGAGLVFRWRGARRHHGGKVAALVITSVFFGFCAYALVVDGLRAPLLTKRTGEVVVLLEDDPACQRLLLQVEERSPFPLRWDPAYDVESMGRVRDATSRIDGRVWDYQPAMVEVPDFEAALSLPSISSRGPLVFDGLDSAWTADEPELVELTGELSVSALIIADKKIQALLPQGELPMIGGVIADEWFGQSFRFLVGVDKRGVVRGCLPLSGGSMEVAKPTDKQKLLAAWLRRISFRPSEQEAGVLGVVEIRIRARKR